MPISLIISTYNNPSFLKQSLYSALFQTVLPDEIIIADDGSTEETSYIIKELQKETSIPIIHVWQEDEGFRAGMIRNKAIAVAQGEYIIQIDGDIIMEKHFIQDHLFHKREKTILQGSRVFISPAKTQSLLKKKNISHLTPFSYGLSHRENAFRIQSISTYLSTRYRNRFPIYYARGCNMSFFRQDFIDVNGYDEDFIGWGHEDSDLTLRMLNNGGSKLYIKFFCVAYHLFHKEADRNRESLNKSKMDKHLSEHATFCNNGVDKYINK